MRATHLIDTAPGAIDAGHRLVRGTAFALPVSACLWALLYILVR